MARILLIETATARLSVALAKDAAVVERRVCDQPRQQASLTAPLVKEVLDSQGLRMADCDAVAVSSGPGSYTGLRVGVSTAKGLCFGAGLPLIAIGTLDILAADPSSPSALQDDNSHCERKENDCHSERSEESFIVPMIDARRMEVYTAVYGPHGQRITPVEAKVIDAQSFAEYLEQGPVLFIGDGALKCKDILPHPNARFEQAWPDAAAMAPLAEKAYQEKRFEDLAYFEPFYLKDFVATVSRKQLF